MPSELPFFNWLPLADLTEEQVAQVNEYFKQIDDSLRWLFENSPAGGGDIGSLDDLADVEIDTPLDLQFLQYDFADGQWENRTIALGGASELDDLSDVVIASPRRLDHLRFDGVEWLNQGAESLTYSYNADKSILGIDGNSVNLDFTYNGDGSIDTMDDQTNIFTYAYLGDGRIDTITVSAS